jgi:hypothetical protein
VSEASASEIYLRMLEGVANRSDRMHGRVIASHWPFVGSDHRRILFVGQALAGWDDPTSPALWGPDAVATEEGRIAVLDATKRWARTRAEPIDEPLRTRASSPFWGVSQRVVETLEAHGNGPWQSRSAWWNLFPLGWGDTNRSPDGPLWMAQVAHVSDLFWEVIDYLEPARVVILAGRGYWNHTATPLGLSDLNRLDHPLIAGGRRSDRTFVWTLHPGGHYAGLSRDAFAAAIVGAVMEIEARAAAP